VQAQIAGKMKEIEATGGEARKTKETTPRIVVKPLPPRKEEHLKRC